MQYRATYTVITTYVVDFDVDPDQAADDLPVLGGADVPVFSDQTASTKAEERRTEEFIDDHPNRVFFEKFNASELQDAQPVAVEGPTNVIIAVPKG